MAESTEPMKVQLISADGRQILPQTSADIVLNLPEAVKKTVEDNKVHFSTGASGEQASGTPAVYGTTRVVTSISVDQYGHVASFTTQRLPEVTGTSAAVFSKVGDGLEIKTGDDGETAPAVKLYTDDSVKGHLSFASDGSIKAGLLYEEIN